MHLQFSETNCSPQSRWPDAKINFRSRLPGSPLGDELVSRLKLAANHPRFTQDTFNLQTVGKRTISHRSTNPKFLQAPSSPRPTVLPLGQPVISDLSSLGFHTPPRRFHAAAAKPPAASAGSRHAAPTLALQREPGSEGRHYSFI